MTVLTKKKDGDYICFAKRAIERVFSRAIGDWDAQGNMVEGITAEYCETVNKTMEMMAKKGHRALALAVRDTSKESSSDEEVSKVEGGDAGIAIGKIILCLLD